MMPHAEGKSLARYNVNSLLGDVLGARCDGA